MSHNQLVRYQIGARFSFAAATFTWALAASAGAAGAGWGALGALLVLLPWIRPGRLQGALRDKYIWATGVAFVGTNACLALAADLLPLPTLAAIGQLSPLVVLWIAPLWGERAAKTEESPLAGLLLLRR